MGSGKLKTMIDQLAPKLTLISCGDARIMFSMPLQNWMFSSKPVQQLGIVNGLDDWGQL